MKRILAIQNLMNTITDEVVIASTGKISREVFYAKDRPLNFYVQGSMGSALPIGIGVAICKPKKEVIVIAGDGEILMGLDSLVLLNKLQKQDKAKNLRLYILDNNSYQSTGNQPTCSDAIDFRLLCDCKVIFCTDSEINVSRIKITHDRIKRRFMEALNY